MSGNKQKIEGKINELDEMLAELEADDVDNADDTDYKSKININGLDVVDVLHNILR